MKPPFRWEHCIVQHDADVLTFVQEFFRQTHRKALLIAGAGFDPAHDPRVYATIRAVG